MSPYSTVCLFGSSPHFADIASFCNSRSVNCILFAAQPSANKLRLPNTLEINYISSLEDKIFKSLEEVDCKIGISMGSPFIFKKRTIDKFQGSLINSHGAPLPDHKGGGGFTWRILQGDKRGMVLMHQISCGIDEGNVVYSREFEFTASDRFPIDYIDKQISMERKYLLPWLYKLILGEVNLTQSKNSSRNSSNKSSLIDNVDRLGTYYPRLNTSIHGYIDWTYGGRELETFVLSFSHPYSGAMTFVGDHKCRIFDMQCTNLSYNHPFTNGIIVAMDDYAIKVSLVNGFAYIKKGDIVFFKVKTLRLAIDSLHRKF